MKINDQAPMTCPGRINLPVVGPPINHDQSHDCRCEITPEALRIHIDSGRIDLQYSWREIITLEPRDYTLYISPFSAPPFTLSHLGYQFDNALRRMRQFRHHQLAEDLLFKEQIENRFAPAYIRSNHPESPLDGPVELCTTPTGLILMPQDSDPRRIAMSEIVGMQTRDYALHLSLDNGVTLAISRLGGLLDPLSRDIDRISQSLLKQTRLWLQSIAPDAPAEELDRAAHLLRDGRSASHTDLMNSAPALRTALDAILLHSPLMAEYSWLSDQCRPQNMGFGIKRGLWGREDDVYLWILALLPQTGQVVFEATSIGEEAPDDQEDPGKATYLFRLPETASPGDPAMMETCLRFFSRAFRAINHRREPIYLSEEQLSKPHYARYLHSVRKIPELRRLRELFIARVIHRSDDQWRQEMHALITRPVAQKEVDHG